jgi:tRNA threonylcarbamoyladenosine biosynthesis protein TsaB
MWVLAINTATDALGVAIVWYERDTVCDVRVELVVAPGAVVTGGRNAASPRSGHSERLMPAIAWTTDAAGISAADLGGVAVVAGPGGFTGIRTGLAVAKAIAQARGIPVWGVDTLEALAAAFPGPGLVSPLLDARRGDVFAALYRRSGAEELTCLTEPTLMPLTAWLAQNSSQPTAYIGEGAERNAAAIVASPDALPVSPESHALRPSVVARLAAPHLLEGGEAPAALVPRYHRAPVMAPDWQPQLGMK